MASIAVALSIGACLAGCEGDAETIDTLSAGLSISPRSATIDSSPAESALFTASGGVPPYTWSLSSSTLGDISESDYNAIYTGAEGETGQNVLTVTDSALNSVSATITQE